MMRHNIPTARYKSITSANLEEGLAFLETLEAPYVLKADGLCAGKGVLILPTLDEAKVELKEMLGGMFGSASATRCNRRVPKRYRVLCIRTDRRRTIKSSP